MDKGKKCNLGQIMRNDNLLREYTFYLEQIKNIGDSIVDNPVNSAFKLGMLYNIFWDKKAKLMAELNETQQDMADPSENDQRS